MSSLEMTKPHAGAEQSPAHTLTSPETTHHCLLSGRLQLRKEGGSAKEHRVRALGQHTEEYQPESLEPTKPHQLEKKDRQFLDRKHNAGVFSGKDDCAVSIKEKLPKHSLGKHYETNAVFPNHAPPPYAAVLMRQEQGCQGKHINPESPAGDTVVNKMLPGKAAPGLFIRIYSENSQD